MTHIRDGPYPTFLTSSNWTLLYYILLSLNCRSNYMGCILFISPRITLGAVFKYFHKQNNIHSLIFRYIVSYIQIQINVLSETPTPSSIHRLVYKRGIRARRLPPEVTGGVVEPVGPKIQISPVTSELTYSLPVPSRNKPAGLKQALGHFVLSGLVKRSTAAVLLSAAATG
jgi:hypothetical protein